MLQTPSVHWIQEDGKGNQLELGVTYERIVPSPSKLSFPQENAQVSPTPAKPGYPDQAIMIFNGGDVVSLNDGLREFNYFMNGEFVDLPPIMSLRMYIPKRGE